MPPSTGEQARRGTLCSAGPHLPSRLGQPRLSAASLPKAGEEEASHPSRFTEEASLSSFGQMLARFQIKGRRGVPICEADVTEICTKLLCGACPGAGSTLLPGLSSSGGRGFLLGADANGVWVALGFPSCKVTHP